MDVWDPAKNGCVTSELVSIVFMAMLRFQWQCGATMVVPIFILVLANIVLLSDWLPVSWQP